MSTDNKSQSSLTQIKSKIKVVFLGDQSTGKTSILMRFMHNKFEDNQGVLLHLNCFRRQWASTSWAKM